MLVPSDFPNSCNMAFKCQITSTQKERHLINLKAIHKNTGQKATDPPNCHPPIPLQATSHEDPRSWHTFFKTKRLRRDKSTQASEIKEKELQSLKPWQGAVASVQLYPSAPRLHGVCWQSSSWPQGTHPSPDSGSHQCVAGWQLAAWNGQTAG